MGLQVLPAVPSCS